MFDASGDNDVVFPGSQPNRKFTILRMVLVITSMGPVYRTKFGTVRSFNSYNLYFTGCWITVFLVMVKCTPDCVPKVIFSFVTSFLLITIFLSRASRPLSLAVSCHSPRGRKFPRFLGHPDKLESTFHRVWISTRAVEIAFPVGSVRLRYNFPTSPNLAMALP